MKIINGFLKSRFFALITKEVNQILRNKTSISFLLISPIIYLLIYGFALNPDVQKLKLGIADFAQTYQSRELVSALTQNNIFTPQTYFLDERKLVEQVEAGKITAGLIIPADFSERLNSDRFAEVQVFIDGVDTNTAGIAGSYIEQIIIQYNKILIEDNSYIPIKSQTTFLYNPGLISSWFFVPGIMGLVYTFVSSLISVGTVIREKDLGTLEQLLMTPVKAGEILLAKIIPLFVLLMGTIFIALSIARLIFNVPFRGNFFLFYLLSALYIFVGIGIGIMLATICNTQTQAFLTSFFINLPMFLLSGAIAPVESMPALIKYLSLLDPLTHYIEIIRGIMLKGVGLEILWQNAVALLVFALIILSISVYRFRRQLI